MKIKRTEVSPKPRSRDISRDRLRERRYRDPSPRSGRESSPKPRSRDISRDRQRDRRYRDPSPRSGRNSGLGRGNTYRGRSPSPRYRYDRDRELEHTNRKGMDSSYGHR